MATMNVSAARENLPGAVELAVFLERYGRPAAVLVIPEHYARLTAALEETEDVAVLTLPWLTKGRTCRGSR